MPLKYDIETGGFDLAVQFPASHAVVPYQFAPLGGAGGGSVTGEL